MERRTFLRNCIAGAFGALVIPKALRANNNGFLWEELVEYARWAPSPHNVQPWKLKAETETKAGLYYDPSRLLRKTDPTSCFTILGFGMFLECMRIVAAERGYVLTWKHVINDRLDYSTNAISLFAILSLEKGNLTVDLDKDLILKRKTSRNQYDGRPVKKKELELLSEIAQKHEYKLNHTSDPAFIEWVLDLNQQTLFDDLSDKESRIELRSLIRTSEEEAQEKRDGLWSKCMGFPGWLMRSFFEDHEKYSKGFRKEVLGKIYLNSMKGTSTVAWISGNFCTPDQWIAAGVMMQQLWLEMTKHDIVLHPFGSVITNKKANKLLNERINEDKETWLLMRMGYSHEPPRSYRLKTKEILI